MRALATPAKDLRRAVDIECCAPPNAAAWEAFPRWFVKRDARARRLVQLFAKDRRLQRAPAVSAHRTKSQGPPREAIAVEAKEQEEPEFPWIDVTSPLAVSVYEVPALLSVRDHAWAPVVDAVSAMLARDPGGIDGHGCSSAPPPMGAQEGKANPTGATGTVQSFAMSTNTPQSHVSDEAVTCKQSSEGTTTAVAAESSQTFGHPAFAGAGHARAATMRSDGRRPRSIRPSFHRKRPRGAFVATGVAGSLNTGPGLACIRRLEPECAASGHGATERRSLRRGQKRETSASVPWPLAVALEALASEMTIASSAFPLSAVALDHSVVAQPVPTSVRLLAKSRRVSSSSVRPPTTSEQELLGVKTRLAELVVSRTKVGDSWTEPRATIFARMVRASRRDRADLGRMAVRFEVAHVRLRAQPMELHPTPIMADRVCTNGEPEAIPPPVVGL